MKQKEIIIGGKTYPITFEFQTILNFEEITKKSFFESEFKKLNDRMALIISAVLTADEKSDLTIEDITGNKDLAAIQEITSNFIVVFELCNEYFQLPKVVKDSEEREADASGTVADGGDEKPKN